MSAVMLAHHNQFALGLSNAQLVSLADGRQEARQLATSTLDQPGSQPLHLFNKESPIMGKSIFQVIRPTWNTYDSELGYGGPDGDGYIQLSMDGLCVGLAAPSVQDWNPAGPATTPVQLLSCQERGTYLYPSYPTTQQPNLVCLQSYDDRQLYLSANPGAESTAVMTTAGSTCHPWNLSVVDGLRCDPQAMLQYYGSNAITLGTVLDRLELDRTRFQEALRQGEPFQLTDEEQWLLRMCASRQQALIRQLVQLPETLGAARKTLADQVLVPFTKQVSEVFDVFFVQALASDTLRKKAVIHREKIVEAVGGIVSMVNKILGEIVCRLGRSFCAAKYFDQDFSNQPKIDVKTKEIQEGGSGFATQSFNAYWDQMVETLFNSNEHEVRQTTQQLTSAVNLEANVQPIITADQAAQYTFQLIQKLTQVPETAKSFCIIRKKSLSEKLIPRRRSSATTTVAAAAEPTVELTADQDLPEDATMVDRGTQATGSPADQAEKDKGSVSTDTTVPAAPGNSKVIMPKNAWAILNEPQYANLWSEEDILNGRNGWNLKVKSTYWPTKSC
ncbi:hypothetical protein H4R33_002122 [Dimargaris cristalligena]|nr:hypothetical protein H4R33_002122 [Dimargaris cristalligena]